MFTIALCCSKKFKKQERAFAKALRNVGLNVYEPTLSISDHWEDLPEDEKLALAAGFTLRHFHKIRKSDAIYVLNIGGYVGNSVNMEIGYAVALNKRVFYMEEETSEYNRKILSDGVAKTPKQLVKLLSSVQTPDIRD